MELLPKYRTWFAFLYSVWLGSVYVDSLSKGEEYYVSRIIIHPKPHEANSDLALLKLSTGVTFTSFILPICLPSTSKQLIVPASCWVTGWGHIKEDKYQSTLQEVEVPIISNQACEWLYNPVGSFLPELEPVIKEGMLCAGERNKDSCKGDSGGPLSCFMNGVWTQIGVVNWGLDCGKGLPGVYTNLIYYQKWINATISSAGGLGDTCIYLTSCSPIVLLSLALLRSF